MVYDLIIKRGTLNTPEGQLNSDLAIRGERIAAFGHSLSGKKEINADGCYVLPGAIDGHIHLDNPKLPPFDPPTADSFATGSVAAAFGGVTTIIDFAQPMAGESLVDEIERRQQDALGSSVIDYGLHLNLRDPDPGRLEEIPEVFARGLPSFKLYMAYDSYRSTDHCPRPKLADKPHQAPGAAGLEVRLAAMHELGVRSGRMSLERWVAVCCSGPAEVFGLSQKGRLTPGYDADVVIFDPQKEVVFNAEDLHTPISFSSFEGMRVRGYPLITISRGEVIVSNNQLVADPGRGRFVERSYD